MANTKELEARAEIKRIHDKLQSSEMNEKDNWRRGTELVFDAAEIYEEFSDAIESDPKTARLYDRIADKMHRLYVASDGARALHSRSVMEDPLRLRRISK